MKAAGALLGLLYPVVVFAGLQWLSPRPLAVLIGLALALRLFARLPRAQWRQLSGLLPVLILVGIPIALSALLDDGRYFRFLPVAVNGALCVAFARTLRGGPSMVETFARLSHPRLPDAHVPYCYRVTIVWAAFFALNALACLWFAVAASLEAWTLYTGLIAYVLAGTLFAAEFVFRAWRFRTHQGAFCEPILRRMFPPRVDA